MMKQSSPQKPTRLQGQIERIVFRKEETGYTVARMKAAGLEAPVTVVGSLATVRPGEIVRLRGEWTGHPKYGEQFKLTDYETVTPATVHGIEKYLGSGLIPGLGPVMARRIVEKFGEQALDVIEHDSGRLAEIEGVGPARIGMIQQAWAEQKEVRAVMLFLQSHDVGIGHATRIFKQYGRRSIELLRENPFRLANDIYGIGFSTADAIAVKLGTARDAPQRVEAGILYVLDQLAGDGQVFFPYEPLIEKCCEVLEVGREAVARAVARAALEKKIVIEDRNASLDGFLENHKAVYLARYHICETHVAQKLLALAGGRPRPASADPKKAIKWVQAKLSIDLADKQREAVQHALQHRVMVITGGPGTGKTTLIHAILKIFSRRRCRILLAAPTGRAARRMSETAGFEAQTIHRLLKYNMRTGDFERNEQAPLECDLLVVDEASMIDIVLMHHLLKAVPLKSTLIMVGDINQIPSVGPGAVLRDIIRSGAVKVVELNEIFRQAQQSRIVLNAHRINHGEMPLPAASGKGLEDFYFIKKESPEEALDTILELAGRRIPERFGFDPLEDIQVLAPMHRGVVGTENLNRQLQSVLNPGRAAVKPANRPFGLNDRVMQVRNDYDRDVFNGDIGRVVDIDSEKETLAVLFYGRRVAYEFADLDELAMAYAVSVHKSQGSEFPAVIVPVLTQHYIMLQRNLIYTAVTRGKRLTVLVGAPRALAMAIKNDRTRRRYTGLAERLAG